MMLGAADGLKRRAARTGQREIAASEAKTHLSQLLDDVERGETVVIARLVPETERSQAEIARAIGRACLRLPFRLEHTMNTKSINLRSRAMTMTPCAWGEDPMNSETT